MRYKSWLEVHPQYSSQNQSTYLMYVPPANRRYLRSVSLSSLSIHGLWLTKPPRIAVIRPSSFSVKTAGGG
jgi:hypothetical protein